MMSEHYDRASFSGKPVMEEVIIPQERKNFLYAALPLALVTLLERAVTFVSHLIIAHLYGVSTITDAYFAAASILLLITGLVMFSFKAAFIPLWMDSRFKGSGDEARRFVDSSVSAATALSTLIGVMMILGAPVIPHVITPGFSPEASAITASLLRVMGLAVVFLGFTAGCTSLLEAHHNFLVPGFSRVAYGAVVIATIVAFSTRFGVMALGWAAVIAAIIRLLVQLKSVWRFGGIRLTRKMDSPGVRKGFRMILPVVIGLAGIQVTFLLDNVVASLLPDGVLAGLAYSIRVVMLPVGIIALPLRTTIFPTLSYQAASDQQKGMSSSVLTGIRYLLFIIVPISAGVLILREPLIHLLFERGSFDSAATHMTASAMGFYALGVPAMAGLTLISNVYFSLNSAVALVKVFLFNWIGNLILNLVLFSPFGHNGIALATSLSTTAAFILALIGLKDRLPALDIRSLAGSVIKISLATALMIGVMLVTSPLFAARMHEVMTSSAFEALGTLLIGGVVGSIAYALGAFAFGLYEMRAIVRAFLNQMPLKTKI